jgi:hypothetical protein
VASRTIIVVIALVALVATGVFVACGADAQAGRDADVIALLKKAGSDLSKPHPIEFYLYLPTREAAERVAAKVRALGCGIKRVGSEGSGPGWLVLATKTMVPVEAELAKLGKEFEALAKVENGEYDGWEAQVTK